ncbi:MAG: hypothetical protein VSS75_001895 [Candidatus Parabeggiatoa sp.]|nr:hypothetical protein [Candidatus Parabeggiatoa sp.]
MTTMSNSEVPLIAPVPISRSKRILNLVYRRLLTFYRDKTDLSITFLQAPILAIAFFFVFQAIVTVDLGTGTFFQALRSYLTTDTVSVIVFLVVLTAVWFGTSKAIVEIPGSMILYQQERLSFLSSFDFMVSLFIALSIIAFGQVFLFSLTFHIIFVVLPAWINPFETGLVVNQSESISLFSALMPILFIKLVCLLWLTAMASIAVAMFISTFFRTRSAANAFLPFLLIIQILLGGSIIKPVIGMNSMVHVIADLMVSRWGFEATALLFEHELNTSMPRYQKEHHEQIDFRNGSFIGTGALSLKSLDPSSYFSVLKNKWNKKEPPEMIDKHPDIANYWYESLFYATDTLASEVSDAESEYIEVLSEFFDALEQRELNPEPFEGSVPIPALLVEHKLPARFLEEAGQYFFGEGGSYYKAVSQVVRGTSTHLTEVEQIILEHAMSNDSRLKFFRPQHTQTTWLMLLLITVATFTLGWINFRRRYK